MAKGRRRPARSAPDASERASDGRGPAATRRTVLLLLLPPPPDRPPELHITSDRNDTCGRHPSSGAADGSCRTTPVSLASLPAQRDMPPVPYIRPRCASSILREVRCNDRSPPCSVSPSSRPSPVAQSRVGRPGQIRPLRMPSDAADARSNYILPVYRCLMGESVQAATEERQGSLNSKTQFSQAASGIDRRPRSREHASVRVRPHAWKINSVQHHSVYSTKLGRNNVNDNIMQKGTVPYMDADRYAALDYHHLSVKMQAALRCSPADVIRLSQQTRHSFANIIMTLWTTGCFGYSKRGIPRPVLAVLLHEVEWVPGLKVHHRRLGMASQKHMLSSHQKQRLLDHTEASDGFLQHFCFRKAVSSSEGVTLDI
ncbi:hypothetical protein F2P81_013710 [Scophthalmus maximus]|uniref:Uncharacterized protein n=1 Tax=Scophthalmus maximus TaxID=52904 RepID=A0A6A4SRI4_SCOMX|nr:hypothetical protein F2P81_013710 [Scophthalmus maximus]